MKVIDALNVLTLVLLVALIGGEVTLWAVNPLGVPASFLPARAVGLQLFRAQGPAMEPAVPEGERVLVSAWSYWHDQPQAGDIVAFVYPRDPDIADLKRVVAVGGSTVELRQGALYVNGVPQDEPYLDASERSAPVSMRPVQVPLNSYFVMADNREQSEDSRHFGPIARASIIGKQWRH
ncbi:MAG: signal peptidase I [Steroidobacteraceae bacterium]